MTSTASPSTLDQNSQAHSLMVTRDTLLVTYDPEERRISIDPLGVREIDVFIRSFTRMVDKHTGATIWILDYDYHTCKSVAKSGSFTFSATTHLENNMININGPVNIKAFDHWLSEWGDEVSANILRKSFPKVFAPPAPPKKRWRLW